jgi:YVTN family beta-propeller protein
MPRQPSKGAAMKVPHRRSFLASLLGGAVVLLGLSAPSAQALNIYVINEASNTVSAIDSHTNQIVGAPIPVGSEPLAIAITPDGSRAYVANVGSDNVSVIDTSTNRPAGPPIAVGDEPRGIAVTPDGRQVYVTNAESGTVSVIDTATNREVGNPIPIGVRPAGIAMAPDGAHAYAVNLVPRTVSVIDTRTRSVTQSVPVEETPFSIAITPDGRKLFVANTNSNTVSVINTQADPMFARPIAVGAHPEGLAVTPNEGSLYVSNFDAGTVSVIDIGAERVIGDPIGGGPTPVGIAFNPGGTRAYVVNFTPGTVSVLDVATRRTIGPPIKVGEQPANIAIGPNLAPAGAFSTLRARPGVPVGLDASASKDSDGGSIVSYAWDFGDRATGSFATPRIGHVYRALGTYQATLTVTDDEGCSTAPVLVGRVTLCKGSALAQTTKTVRVAYPGVRVRCPRQARPKGCVFKLQAVAKASPRRRAKAQSAVATARVKAGRSAIVSLKAKPAFRKKLALAKRVLVKRTLIAGGARRTVFTKLKIVQ